MPEKYPRLSRYRAPQIWIDCGRCNRHGTLNAHRARQEFGDIGIEELARQVAEQGGCELAKPEHCLCLAYPVEPPFWTWATLRDAVRDGWTARVSCKRSRGAMHRVEDCPRGLALDLQSLQIVLGDDYTLQRVQSRAHCPRCGTKAVEVDWIRPRGRSTMTND